MRSAFAAALALAISASASAAVLLEVANQHSTIVPSGAAGEVVALAPFQVDQPGAVYAKLLVTPWNAVNAGVPNGTVANGAGVSGWWIEFEFTNASGGPMAASGGAQRHGPFADSTPTALVPVEAETTYRLAARIHYPADAARPGASHRVVFALAFRAGESSAAGSGGTLDPSRSFTETIEVPNAGGAGGGREPPVSSNPQPVVAPATGWSWPAGWTGTLVVAAATLGVLAVVVAAVASSFAAWGALEALREVRALRRGEAPPAPGGEPPADEASRVNR